VFAGTNDLVARIGIDLGVIYAFSRDRANPMKPSGTVRDLVAVFADLKFALAVGRANYQPGFTFFVWRPLLRRALCTRGSAASLTQ
jgi:hypothetical protein